MELGLESSESIRSSPYVQLDFQFGLPRALLIRLVSVLSILARLGCREPRPIRDCIEARAAADQHCDLIPHD